MKFATTASAFALALSAASAFAADLPALKAPPPAAAVVPMWTGFYAGLNIGYGFGGSGSAASNGWETYNQYATAQLGPRSATMTNAGNVGGLGFANTGTASQNQSGVIGGGQIGYNLQYGKSFLVGLEADFQGAGIGGKGSFSGLGRNNVYHTYPTDPTKASIWHSENAFAGTTNISSGLNWLGTLRGRLGYLVTPSLLVFGTGGLTYGGAYANVNSYGATQYIPWAHLGHEPITMTSFFGNASASSVLVGWNAGGGLEWMFMQNWSAKAEAFYYDLGSMNLSGSGYQLAANPTNNAAAYMSQTRVSYNGVIARAGVNYHFNWGSTPVIASY